MTDAPRRASEHHRDDEAAGGRPFGAGPTAYGRAGPKLVDDRYEPLPIKPVSKAPASGRWTEVAIDEAQVDAWASRFPDHGVGLRTGRLVDVDIDLLDPDAAHEAERLSVARRGPTPLLVYRTEAPFAKIAAPGIEILGLGQQFVAFGVHPDTGRPYAWTDEAPLDVPLRGSSGRRARRLRRACGRDRRAGAGARPAPERRRRRRRRPRACRRADPRRPWSRGRRSRRVDVRHRLPRGARRDRRRRGARSGDAGGAGLGSLRGHRRHEPPAQGRPHALVARRRRAEGRGQAAPASTGPSPRALRSRRAGGVRAPDHERGRSPRGAGRAT